MAGFGGVAEYGITVRWDKNFLKLVRLLLERRAQFSMYGGVRFGGTVTIDDAFAMGFDHIALCAGAGRPTVIPMENGLALGVRQASDFLMALQLTGAAKTDSIANLTVRLPVVVIGGGLTAIDTATEALAYYPVQVEKFLARYEALCGRARRRVGAGRVDRARGRRGRRVHRPCQGAARRARGGEDGGPRAAFRADPRRLGRGHDRLSPPPDRCAELHPQPRGGGEGDGGGHPLRRGDDAGRGRGRPLRSRHRAEAQPRAECAATRPSPRSWCCRRGRFSSPPGPSRIRCWRARTRRMSRSTAAISRRSTRRATRSRRSVSPSPTGRRC